MQMLIALARRPGEVANRSELIEACWAGRQVGEDAIQRALARVRRLGERSGAFAIETVARVGYRLNPADAASVWPGAPPLLAVLPFDTYGDDVELGFFADGLSDEISHVLVHATRLRLIGRGSCFQLRGAARTASSVRERLGATHLLDGSVRRGRTTLRIGVQLIETSNSSILWSESFDRPIDDGLSLQTEIATAVARALHHKFHPQFRGEVEPVHHERLFRAFHAALDGPSSLAHVEAIDALAHQTPDYALGWSFAAEARHYLRMRPDVSDELATTLYTEQRHCAERAMALDPTAASVLLAYGGLQPPCGAFTERERIFRAADGYGWPLPPLTYVLLQTGRSSEALAAAALGREREPLVGPVRMAHQLALAQLGRLDEWAIMVDRDLRTQLVAPHERATIAQLAALFGRPDAAAHPEFPFDEQPAAFAALEASVQGRGYPSFLALTAACRFGDIERLWDIISRSRFDALLVPGGRMGSSPDNCAALFLPHAAPLRQDRRFLALCARLGLVRHWIETDRWPDCADEVPYDFRAEARRLVNG